MKPTEFINEATNGRFKWLAGLALEDSCMQCFRFNHRLEQGPGTDYRCAVLGRCPGITLSETMKQELWKYL